MYNTVEHICVYCIAYLCVSMFETDPWFHSLQFCLDTSSERTHKAQEEEDLTLDGK